MKAIFEDLVANGAPEDRPALFLDRRAGSVARSPTYLLTLPRLLTYFTMVESDTEIAAAVSRINVA